MKIAVIPARGGSKRIPRKNIRMFCGKPIIAYSIAAAQQTGLFDQVVVSTDDEEIASVAREFGAATPFIRPKEIADDFTGTNAVVKHAVAVVQRAVERRHACVLSLRHRAAAAGALHHGRLRGPLPLGRRLCVFCHQLRVSDPARRAHHAGRRVDAIYPEHRMTRSQDLEHAYHDAGQFYWGTARAFLEDMPLFAPHSIGVILPRHLVQDIDTLEDWDQAELMYRALHRT